MTKKNFIIMVIAFVTGVIVTTGVQNRYYEERFEELNAQLEESETRYNDFYEIAGIAIEGYIEYAEEAYDELNELAEDYAYELEEAGIGTPYSDNEFDDFYDTMEPWFDILDPWSEFIIERLNIG